MNTVFLIDLDKTLIDRNYQPTTNVILFRKLIKSLIEQGDIFVLCSDSALDTLLYWRNFFCFNGAIVYENGMAINWGDGKQQLTLSAPFNGIILRQELKQKLSRLYPNAQTIEVNYLSVMRYPHRFSAKRLIVLNPYRRYSLSMHALKLKNKHYIYDSELAKELADYLQDFIYDERIEDVVNLDTNLEYALNILKPYCARKLLALPFFRQRYPSRRLVVIGDGLQESLMAGLVDEVWAVNNACPQLKQKADKVAKSDITQGVYELLMDYQTKTK